MLHLVGIAIYSPMPLMLVFFSQLYPMVLKFIQDSTCTWGFADGLAERESDCAFHIFIAREGRLQSLLKVFVPVL